VRRKIQQRIDYIELNDQQRKRRNAEIKDRSEINFVWEVEAGKWSEMFFGLDNRAPLEETPHDAPGFVRPIFTDNDSLPCSRSPTANTVLTL